MSDDHLFQGTTARLFEMEEGVTVRAPIAPGNAV
jgi:hypothetical protein